MYVVCINNRFNTVATILSPLSVAFTFRLPLCLSSVTAAHLRPSSRKQTDLVRQNTNWHRITLTDFQSFRVISYNVTSHFKEIESIFVLVLRCLWIMS